MNKLKDLILVVIPTLVLGIVGSLIGAQGAVILGSLAGAVVGTVVTTKRQEERDVRLKLLENQTIDQKNWDRIKSELPKLQSEVQHLQEVRQNLGQVEGQLVQKKEEVQQVDKKLTGLVKQQQELEQRVMVIQQQNPDLSTLEQVQTQIGEFQLNKRELEGQTQALHSQIEQLEQQKQSLLHIQADYATKKSQYEQLVQQIEDYRQEAQALEQKTAELELLRATYDGLFQEKQTFEARVNQLRPEIERLEAEKQRILGEIQANQREFERIEELRRTITDLKIQIRTQESQLRDIEREIQALEGQKASLEGTTAGLRQEKAKLEQQVKELKGQIDSLENSTEVALRALREPLWTNLPTDKWTVSGAVEAEQEFLNGLTTYLREAKGLTFPSRVIQAFHTSLKVQDISALVILAGISGTGKSELPQQYAHYVGAQRLTLAVQPRWDSPQDLQGFYNYIEKKFKPTELMQGLYQYNHDRALNDRMVMVLLDEMNLARVEYYFSEFLSKLETRRSYPTYLEIEVGSLPMRPQERQLRIPEQFLFVGTMNEDETTQTLSDKVLDRANVLTFGKPKTLALREERQTNGSHAKPHGYLAYSQFASWMRQPVPNSPVVKEVSQYLDEANRVMEKMGHPFAHRVYQAITKYVVNYPGGAVVNSEAFKAALADQFGQKLLPKWRGLMVDDYHEEFEEFTQVVQKLGDSALSFAWQKAKDDSQRSGQFQWKGLIYPEQ